MPFVWLLPLALIVATAVFAGLFAHPIETPAPSPIASPETSITVEPTVLATTTSTPATTLTSTPTATPTIKPTLSPSPYQGEGRGEVREEISISFLDLPAALPAGEKTKITIKIDGPAGATGTDAKIKVKYHASEENNGSSSSIKTDISNSFGRFTTPATFSMNLSLGQEKSPIKLTASAEVDGQTIETSKTIELK